MVFGRNIIIYDLDETLYGKNKEFSDLLDKTMAETLVYDFGLKMSVQEAKELVTKSYKMYRDGGEIFYKDYGIDNKAFFRAYHRRKPVEKIIPYDNLIDKIKNVPAEQYVFTASDRYASEKILKHLGLFEFFKGRYFSVEDFGVFKKNKSAKIYEDFCEKIKADPHDAIFVDDSYSNLKFAKEAGMTTVKIYYKDNSSGDKDYIDYAYKGIESFLEDALTNKVA